MKRDIDEITAMAEKFHREAETEGDRARRLALIGLAISLHRVRVQIADIEALAAKKEAA